MATVAALVKAQRRISSRIVCFWLSVTAFQGRSTGFFEAGNFSARCAMNSWPEATPSRLPGFPGRPPDQMPGGLLG